jgi:hypothetical protein
MKESLYSTKDIAAHFEKSVDWVHRMTYEFGIQPTVKRLIEGHLKPSNFYTKEQLYDLERKYNIRQSKKEKVTVFVTTTFYIFESKMNYLPDL